VDSVIPEEQLAAAQKVLKTETSAVRHDLPFGALLVTCPVAAGAAPLSQFR